VSATLVSATDQTSGLTFNSIGYGTSQFVSVKKIGEGGTFFSVADAQAGNITQRDTGRDVTALINGALATGKGLDVSLNTPALGLKLNLTDDFANATGVQKTFTITGGGVNFQLGPSINATQQVGFGVQSVAASRLGGTAINSVRYFLDSLKSGQANSILSGRAQEASEVLDNAITDISVLRGRLGAFEKNTIQTNIRSLQVGFENITASESQIRDADFAQETAALTRAQILTQAGTSVLASFMRARGLSPATRATQRSGTISSRVLWNVAMSLKYARASAMRCSVSANSCWRARNDSCAFSSG